MSCTQRPHPSVIHTLYLRVLFHKYMCVRGYMWFGAYVWFGVYVGRGICVVRGSFMELNYVSVTWHAIKTNKHAQHSSLQAASCCWCCWCWCCCCCWTQILLVLRASAFWGALYLPPSLRLCASCCQLPCLWHSSLLAPSFDTSR